ncbi:MAG: pyruvate kinase [Bacteroidales bacterium]
MKYTKIIASISDIRCEVDFIRSLYDEGMNVARMNTAHITEESALNLLNNIRAVSEEIAILIDTKGPEVRTVSEDTLELKIGDRVTIVNDVEAVSAKENIISTNYDRFVKDVPGGSSILIDDGETELLVIDKQDNKLICDVMNIGTIKNKKSINVPKCSFDLPALTEKDIKYIRFAARNKIDFIAHSFVRSKADVDAVQKILNEEGSDAKIIAKIENEQGVKNIDEILDSAYGIMVARGDLGIEVPAEKLPVYQVELVRKCVQRSKIVIIATQMLHTMIDNPRPTRAEVSDIATAIFSRTDAIMLSGETAYGKYPVESVRIMSKIAREVEKSKNKRNDIVPNTDNDDVAAHLAGFAVQSAEDLNAKAIVTNTLSGKTARYISAFRGVKPVYAMCYNESVMRKLAISYGVFPFTESPKKNKEKTVKAALDRLIDDKVLTKKDLVVYAGGSFGVGGGTTFVEISDVDSLTRK